VYCQTEDAEKHDVGLQRVFDRGKAAETQAFIEYCEAFQGTDCELIRQQDRVPRNDWGIGGVIDWWLRYRDEDGHYAKVPCEFKSCTRRMFDSIETVEDMKNHRWPHCRRWPAQLMIYLLLTNREQGMFLLRCVEDFRDKQIPVTLDLEYGESLLQKAESVRDAVRGIVDGGDPAKLMPPRIRYDGVTCESCPYMRRCIPDITQLPEVEARIWDVEMDALCRIQENPLEGKVTLTEWQTAQEDAEQAEEKVKSHMKKLIEGLPKGEHRVILTEHFEIKGTSGETTSYDIPEAIKKAHAIKKPTQRVTIRRQHESD
jgi:hypothetical protein